MNNNQKFFNSLTLCLVLTCVVNGSFIIKIPKLGPSNDKYFHGNLLENVQIMQGTDMKEQTNTMDLVALSGKQKLGCTKFNKRNHLIFLLYL